MSATVKRFLGNIDMAGNKILNVKVDNGTVSYDPVNYGQLQAVSLTPGPKGDRGDTGLTGNTGSIGPGVANGGTVGQVLTKVDGTNYNTQWHTLIASDIGAAPVSNPSFSGNAIISGGSLRVDNGINMTGASVFTLGYDQAGGATLKYNGNGNLDITPRGGYNTAFTAGNVLFGGIAKPLTDNSFTLGVSGARWSQLWAATATINTSDERTKNTINDSVLGLDFISKLRPVSYKFNVGQNIITSEPDGKEEITIKDAEWDVLSGKIISPAIKEIRTKFKQVITPRPGYRTHYGLIAQEVKAVLGDTDFGGYVHDTATDSMGLRYSEFIAPLIKAVQELKSEVDALKKIIK